MIEIIIITGFLVFGCLFLIFVKHKKEEFNLIRCGDEIFYPVDNYYHNDCFTTLEIDTVFCVEYYDDTDEVKFVYTEKGYKYNFLDYIRDNFMLTKFH